MWQFFIKGGVVMIPLALCSVTALTIIVERLLFYWRTSRWEEREIKQFKVYLSQGKFDEAQLVTSQWESTLGRIAETVLKHRHEAPKLLESAVEATGYSELRQFERGLSVLDTIVTASPLLGLLGTVTGIIKAFSALAAAGENQALHLSMGISEALHTTAFGLAIAIPTLFFVNSFYKIVEKRVQKLNLETREILAIIQKNSGDQDGISN